MLRRAHRLLSEGRTEEHRRHVEKAVSEFPDDPDVRLEYAVALRSSEPTKAREEALHAIDLDKSGDVARLTKAARTLMIVGDLDTARAWVERGLSLEGDNGVVATELRSIRGHIAVREKNYESAELDFRAAHEAEPTDARFTRDLAALLARDGRFAEALQIIDQTLALELRPRSHAEQDRAMLEGLREQIARSFDDAPPLARPPSGDGSESPDW
jgi:Flp pilus assembly protein TadD